jgi:hypothetical protein
MVKRMGLFVVVVVAAAVVGIIIIHIYFTAI